MLMTDLHYVGAFLNSYLLNEAHLHDDVDVKEVLNRILQNTTSTLIAYALLLNFFVDFVKN
jgi:hypothetical protein